LSSEIERADQKEKHRADDNYNNSRSFHDGLQKVAVPDSASVTALRRRVFSWGF
jgi:hypothetical protein